MAAQTYLKIRARTAALAAALALCSSCTSIGPHPTTITLANELAAQVKIGRILVLPPLGTGTNDQEAELNRIVPAAVFGRYREATVVGGGLVAAVKSLGMPENAGEVLGASWQALFYDWLKAGKRDPAHMVLEVPYHDLRVPKSDRDLHKLARTLRKRKKDIDALKVALEHAEGAELAKAVTAQNKALAPVETLHRYLLRRLKVTYVVASILDGTAEDFEGKRPITLHAALINAKTGSMRYYSVSVGRKGDIPTDFTGLVGVMAKNLFEDAKEVDGIEM